MPEASSAVDTAPVLLARYRDAYRVARAIDGTGATFKSVGVVGGFIFGLTAFAIGTKFGSFFAFAGIILAGIIAAILFVSGILLSAQGQILKAALDSAVNSSPFLTNAERLSMMVIEPEFTAGHDGSTWCARCGVRVPDGEGGEHEGAKYCGLHYSERAWR